MSANARRMATAVAVALLFGTAGCSGDNPAASPTHPGTRLNETPPPADSGSTARGGVTFGSGG